MSRRITLDTLRHLNACDEQFRLFDLLFPDGADVTRESCQRAAENGLNIIWLVFRLNTASYEAVYQPIWDAYNAAVEPHRAAYDIALTRHRDTYDAPVKLLLDSSRASSATEVHSLYDAYNAAIAVHGARYEAASTVAATEALLRWAQS